MLTTPSDGKGTNHAAKNIREALSVTTGERMTLIRQNNQVIVMNAAVYAMKMLQASMADEAEKAGLHSERDVNQMLGDIRLE